MTKVEPYIGSLQVGDLIGDLWYCIRGIDDPKVVDNINRIKMQQELFKGFELWIVGGVVEGWHTWDIDWVVTGPYQPKKIKKILDWIIEVGFDLGIYPDATYVEEVMDLHEWQNSGICKDRWIWKNTNVYGANGRIHKNPKYHEMDGLWRRWAQCPYKKNVDMDAKGHKYHKPVKIL